MDDQDTDGDPGCWLVLSALLFFVGIGMLLGVMIHFARQG